MRSISKITNFILSDPDFTPISPFCLASDHRFAFAVSFTPLTR